MLVAERRKRILQLARASGIVSLQSLAAELETSEVTVRRDVNVLAAQGVLLRTHGGAILPDGLAHEPSYSEKAGLAAAEKFAIARTASELIKMGDSVLLGPGTTTQALARRLMSIRSLTVVTNSLLVAQVLVNSPGVEVLMIGGSVRGSIQALVGPRTTEALRGLRVSQAFLSGNGITASRGLTTPNPLVAATDEVIASVARQVVVLADHTKVGHDTMCQTVPLERIDILVTDDRADSGELSRIRDAGVDVRVAPVE